MLNLTADIAEELLRLKDARLGELPDVLKLKIISLAELAATPTSQAVEEEAISSDLAEVEVEKEYSETVSEAKVEFVSEPEPVSNATEVESDAIDAEPEDLEEAEVTDVVAESVESEAVDAEQPIESKESVELEASAESVESEPVYAPQPKSQSQPVYEKRQSKPRQQLNPADLQRAFSINDEFLFCREIFKGVKSEYLRALDYIAKLPNRWALQVFLVEELGLNLNESPGKEFYQALVVFFK